jgi:hypothetical protein
MRRQMQNSRTRERQRAEFLAARQALEKYRRNGDASGFDDLQRWVERHGASIPSYRLDAWGARDLGLTQEEYETMKRA